MASQRGVPLADAGAAGAATTRGCTAQFGPVGELVAELVGGLPSAGVSDPCDWCLDAVWCMNSDNYATGFSQ